MLEAYKTAKSLQELSEAMEKSTKEFNEVVDKTTKLDDLKEMEKEIESEWEEFDKALSEAQYPLPEEVEVDGKTYSKSAVAKNIIYFINKLEVEFKAALGLHQMVQFWKSNPETIHYAILDSTLRTLNTVKFKGDQEWTDILAINNYMAQMQDLYSRDNEYQYYISAKHNKLMDRMTLVATPEERAELNLPATDMNAVAGELQDNPQQ